MTKIAIIEDDAMIAQMYQMKFELDGFNVEISNNGEDGLRMVENFKPDLLLLDVKIPKIDGIRLLEKIRARKDFANLPVILLTNSDRSEIPEDINHLKITDYIVKANLTPRQVAEKVKNTLK
ncbi:MAG: response regulator [bacterium]|nr:response regulator [bacterium]